MTSAEQKVCQAFGNDCGDLPLGKCLRELSRKWHPDRTVDAALHEKLKKFNILMDGVKSNNSGARLQAITGQRCDQILPAAANVPRTSSQQVHHRAQSNSLWIIAAVGITLVIGALVVTIAYSRPSATEASEAS